MRKVLAILTLLVLLISCAKEVHQWPEEPGVDPTEIITEVEVVCNIELNVEAIVTKGTLAPIYSDEDRDKYLRRFFVDIYHSLPTGEDTLVFSDTFFQDVDSKQDLSFTTILHSRKYKAIVWMDYILREDMRDLHYNTSKGLSSITIRPADDYIANSNFKDAQTVNFPIDLTNNKDWFAHIVVDIPLVRPVAKVTFETIDFEQFARKMGYEEKDFEKLAEQYTINMIYSAYLPTGFNAWTQKLNDAAVGYKYVSKPVYQPETKYAKLGFDYVFVNGEQSSVIVSVEIRDNDGNVVNRVDNINVPIYRGKETIVRDKFFTKEYNPGIGINPEFDGEFNIYV